ncbi:histone-like nucleoid-structuring protein Lsr2 [Nakamurella sp. A5-74]|uniref:Histone-like nucleoid-structuring protein Lsr2 n=1 Tax=Nakamurella sp. A5-74 TaxID=3158264 RepID=A0AAU8DPP9_9ACTN
MPDDLLIARNPEPDSKLPYLVRIPLGAEGIVVKARETWPRASKVFCHRSTEWPADAEIIERWPVRACTRRGPAIDLILERARENRSQFVVTMARGREMVFWQSPRTTKQARPNVTLPRARAHGQVLEILVDSAEKYPWRFSAQQATTRRQRLTAGDYAVELDGEVIAAVERKTLEDLASSLLNGKLRYAAAELATLPRGAIVVEDRYSKVFDLPHVAGATVAGALAELQARHPQIPVVFTESRPLAQEWSYRWLGACRAELLQHRASEDTDEFVPAGPVPPKPASEASAAEIRAWAEETGVQVNAKGRIPATVRAAFQARHDS